MNTLCIIAVGHLDTHTKALFSEYAKRIPWKMNIFEYKGMAMSSVVYKKYCNKLGTHVVLTESGTLYTSQTFSTKLNQWFESGHVYFYIGGAAGFDFSHSGETFSLGRMTFPHRLARVLLVEQLYRSYTLLQHSPYHK